MTARRRQPATTGIVLAGGRSSRFGSDKLLGELGGRTILERSVRTLADACAALIIVVAPSATPPAFSGPLPIPIRLVRDPVAFGGPLFAIAAGLEAAGGSSALVVAGDTPWLVASVLELLLAELASGPTAADAVALEEAGRRQQLPFAVRVTPGRAAAARLVAAGARRIDDLLDELHATVLDEGRWTALDPGRLTLRDVDRPSDLELPL